jgi:peptide methionine sulfoxide reductase MsrA
MLFTRKKVSLVHPTEIAKTGSFYDAEDYHQQYLHKSLLRSLSTDCLFGPIPVAA